MGTEVRTFCDGRVIRDVVEEIPLRRSKVERIKYIHFVANAAKKLQQYLTKDLTAITTTQKQCVWLMQTKKTDNFDD